MCWVLACPVRVTVLHYGCWQEERVEAVLELDHVGRDVVPPGTEAVPGGSFLNDVLPMHLLLKDLLKVPAQVSDCVSE